MNRPFGPDKGLLRGPEHYWRQIKALADGFTVRDILDRSKGVGRVTVRTYVIGLVKLGYVVEAGRRSSGDASRFPAAVYRCIRPVAIAPVLSEGSSIHGQAAQQLWNAMRVLPQFTADELAVAASTEELPIKPTRAKAFILGLRDAGLVRVVQPKRGRLNGSTPAIYALLRSANTGPRPPRINMQRRGVFDANTRRWIDNIRNRRRSDGASDAAEVPA